MSSEYLEKVNNIITSTDIRNLVGLSTTGVLVFNDDITWLKFKYNNKILFISNRCVLYGITWNQMDNVGITTGKAININGTEYLCRSISATDNGTWNGQPIAGEWKDLIMKYTPNVSDSYWNEYYTICRDEGQNSSHATIVGKSSIDTIMQFSKTASHSTYAWRPVLEINPYCNISISDENLGELFNPFSPKNYIVNGSSHTLTEKLDGVVIRTLENQLDGAKYTLDLSSQWDSISYGKHTIEIIATDSNGLSSSVILTFSKVKETVATIPIVSNLKQVIEHSKEIKKEIEYQSLKLKNNLIKKGVECSDSDKMSSLVDRVNNIKGFKMVPGDTYSIPEFVSKSNNTTTTMNVVTDFNVTMGGNLRLSLCYWLNTHYGSTLYAQIIVTVKRNSETYYTETIPLTITSTGSVYVNIDKISFEYGDTLTVFMGFKQNYKDQYRLYGSLSNISYDLEEF